MLIRTINISKYDSDKKRLQYWNTFTVMGEGVSVFNEECVNIKGGSVCKHIREYYQTTVGNPALYCRIECSILKNEEGFEKVKFVETPSENGDECHVDIRDVTKKKLSNFAQTYFSPPNLYVCCNGVSHKLSNEEYEDLINFIKACAETKSK